jgi:hypothetical protein
MTLPIKIIIINNNNNNNNNIFLPAQIIFVKIVKRKDVGRLRRLY